ncbi:MAG: endonuclease/exonuclease/phosphatase family protein [Terracidiphilus sp.]
MPRQLRKLECDIVLLQEIYGYRNRHWLAESLKDVYPHAIYPRMKRNFGLENGLMAFSRYFASGNVELFRDTPRHEALFDSKGMLITQHRLSEEDVLTAVNFHTTAGGVFKHPEDRRTEGIRARQIAQVLDCASRLSSPLIVAGDLNAGPGVSEVNFRQILNAGFVSLHDLLHSQSPDVTWDPRNSLNVDGPHKTSPPQRIDHVFIRSEDWRENRVRPLSSAICLLEPVVQVESGTVVTVSDHFGICVEIDVSREALSGGADGTC